MHKGLKLADAVVALGYEIKDAKSAPVVSSGSRPDAASQLFQMVFQQQVLKVNMSVCMDKVQQALNVVLKWIGETIKYINSIVSNAISNKVTQYQQNVSANLS